MIVLKNLTLRRGTRRVLDEASAVLNPGEKVGLVGRNGAGKSSLFALLAGALHEDAGECRMPPTWRLAQVAQDMPETAQSATDFVIAGDTALMAAQAEARAAETAGDGERMAHAYTALADAGAHDARARAQALILGLGFRTDELERPVNGFSGGWRMRLQLARALMCPSDLLLLDEPTNHLDLDALVWLEGWLKRYEGTLLIVSHDREFLDAVTHVTLHIERGKLTRYGGNYSAFEALRAQQMLLQQAAYEKQQAQIARLSKFIDRFKAKATKARQAQSRVKALERMERLAPMLADAEFSFEFREPVGLPNPMLALREVDCGYPPPADAPAGRLPTTIVRKVSRTIAAGQRIGILGANGQGKSTLVKTLVGALPPLAGGLVTGKGLSIGYFAQQELDILRPQESPLEHLMRLALAALPEGESGREQDLRNYLGSFHFTGDMAHQPVGTMSGGEKARLTLALAAWQRPNLLLLDEPTNHLDLVTREALSVALNAFEGAVILVSHDRALLRAVCDEFWLVARGCVTPFDGDLDDYQRFLLDEARKRREAEKVERAACARAKPALAVAKQAQMAAARQTAARLKSLRRAQEKLDDELHALQTRKQTIEARFAEGGLPVDEIASLGNELKMLDETLAVQEERWLELAGDVERIEATSSLC